MILEDEIQFERLVSMATRREPQLSMPWLMSKRVFDFPVALLLLFLLSPFLLVVSLAVASSGRPIVFAHTRIGRGGKQFKCYKFRTMVPDAEHVLRALLAASEDARLEWARDHKLRNDPRVTRIGAFLRKTSLDEIPQLFNVLAGHMSLVGPRPIVQQELNRYGRAARWYLAVRPGMTGLWQVSGRNDTDYRRRIALDAYYVKSASWQLELSIFLMTIRVVLGRRGAY